MKGRSYVQIGGGPAAGHPVSFGCLAGFWFRLIYFYSQSVLRGSDWRTFDESGRRYHNASTYETLLTHYKLEDKHLIYIGKIVHDIEVNVWEKKTLPETRTVQQAVVEIITSSNTPDEIITRSLVYFDGLYNELKRRNAS
jgi:hypothetical protein